MNLDHIEQSNSVKEDYPTYLDDESGIVKDGKAEKILFPTSIEQISQITAYCNNNSIPITISGGGTGISGGRVPRKGWIIATDQITNISHNNATNWTDPETGKDYQYKLEKIDNDTAIITVPISMTLKSLQILCRQLNWFYPVDPTERSCFIGGNVATNASGARTFKYGTTRDWIQELKVILASGDLISFNRSNTEIHKITENSIIIHSENHIYNIPRPSYKLPNTDKNVAGPVITDTSDPMDLFIGTGGMFGIIAEPTFKLIRPPREIISLFIYTKDRHQAYRIIEISQNQKSERKKPIPMSVEYLGPRAVEIIKNVDSQVPDSAVSLVMIEQDASSEDEMMEFLEFWWNKCEEIGVAETSVAQNHQEIEHHKMLRHKVPETVNATVRSYGQAKLGTDYSVPNSVMRDLFEFVLLKGEEFEEYQEKRKPLENGFGYAIWAHAGNSHVHLNLLPRDSAEDKFAKGLVTEVLEKVVELNGSIAAEHGLGKKKFQGKPALLFQYQQMGMDEIVKMKSEIDPNNILAPGNLIQ